MIRKKDMICEMEENFLNPVSTQLSLYEDVLAEYRIFKDETEDDGDLFPNGRDYDAEDEDGPF